MTLIHGRFLMQLVQKPSTNSYVLMESCARQRVLILHVNLTQGEQAHKLRSTTFILYKVTH